MKSLTVHSCMYYFSMGYYEIIDGLLVHALLQHGVFWNRWQFSLRKLPDHSHFTKWRQPTQLATKYKLWLKKLLKKFNSFPRVFFIGTTLEHSKDRRLLFINPTAVLDARSGWVTRLLCCIISHLWVHHRVDDREFVLQFSCFCFREVCNNIWSQWKKLCQSQKNSAWQSSTKTIHTLPLHSTTTTINSAEHTDTTRYRTKNSRVALNKVQIKCQEKRSRNNDRPAEVKKQQQNKQTKN